MKKEIFEDCDDQDDCDNYNDYEDYLEDNKIFYKFLLKVGVLIVFIIVAFILLNHFNLKK